MTGEYRNTIDEKGRLMIPPKFREQMGNLTELYLTKTNTSSLWLFTKEGYEALASRVNSDPLAALNTNVVMIKRLIIDPAREVELDKAGRLSIPQVLRDFASIGLKEECVILGSGNKLEICSARKYDEYVAENLCNLGKAGDAVSSMGQK